MVKVFLVDDEIVIREGIRNSFPWEESGYTLVGEAPDGEIALPMIRDANPDILITDIRMPFMDGMQLCREVKRQMPWIGVVILSGYDDFTYARQAISLGVKEYLLKPVDETSLGESIQACIDRIAQQRDLVQEENVSKRVIAYINAHYQEDIFLDKLAEEFNFSTKYLSSLVKNETGKSFSTYLTDLRLDRAIDLLLHTDLGIKEIAASVGYSDPRYFHRLFKKHVGKTPSQYRK